MKLVCVSVAQPRTVTWQGREVRTGIFKAPVAGKIRVARLNLDGDAQADLRVHGGEDKAVYAYPAEHYGPWSRELGRQLPFGQFGENLTVEGVQEDQVCIGDVLRIGTALFQVSQPRTPCFKLGIRMEDDAFPQRFLESGRSGFYLRVLEEGELQAGDPIHLESRDPHGLTVLEICRLIYSEPGDPTMMRRAAELAPLSHGWRLQFRQRLGQRESGDAS
jgi:MOSC domain-containing protein YiiM